MTTSDPSRDRLTRAFSSIAQTLESTDEAEHRIVRSLELLRELVPYRSCALYSAPSRTEGQLYVVPPLPEGAEREALASHLLSSLRSVSGADSAASSERGPHLTLPVVGLDRVIGVLRVEPPETVAYDAGHASLLSIVAAQLGAYLTGLKLQEDQARRLRDLQAAHDFQRLLVGVVGHDLRNPLSTILAGATVLDHAAVPLDEQRELAGRIKRNVRRAAKIIDDLLDLTQIQIAGGLKLDRKPTDLVPLVKELVDDAHAAEPERPIRFETSASAIITECDPDRVAQVVTNLVGNALRHGSVEHEVLVRLSADDTRAKLSVHNGGAPIAPALLPIIFDPFRRGAGKKKGSRESLGLGLYIVREIVRSHGGEIDVSSDERETVFRVSLMRTMPSEERAPFTESS
jgi:signal transduction histidine kinase